MQDNVKSTLMCLDANFTQGAEVALGHAAVLLNPNKYITFIAIKKIK